mgnify:CR=1 FL=1
MRIATWNVNSLTVRLPQVLEWLKLHQPDVLALQETKLEDPAFPLSDLQAAGYWAVFSGQRTYNGVAILSKMEPSDVATGIPGFEDEQRRVIAATVGGVRIVNLYVPNGEALDSPKFVYKGRWLEALTGWLGSVVREHEKVVVLGDFNIAPEEIDVWSPERMEGKALFSAPERAAFKGLLGLGFADSLRTLEPDAKLFSWWDFRGGRFQKDQGMRIDHILVSRPLVPELRAAWVDRDARAVGRASDHAPVVCDLFEAHPRVEPAALIEAGTQGIPDAEEFVPPVERKLPENRRRTRPTAAILVDGHSLAFRMYFGVPPVKTPGGLPVHAVLGFARALLEVYKELGGDPTQPESGAEGPAMVVVFDAPVATFRHGLFADYKGGRDEIPADLPAQIRLIKRLVDTMGWVRLEVAEVEADDAIGTLAKRAEAAGIPSLIVSSDRDLYQLLSPLVKVRGKDGKLFGPEELQAQYGVSVAQWVDYRSLTGDPSDNIPGAKGVGEKTASSLLQKYGDLDGILAAAQALGPDRPLKLVAASRENVLLSRELVRLKLDVEIPFTLEEAATVVRDNRSLGRLLDELGFKSLRRDLRLGEGGPSPTAQPEAAKGKPASAGGRYTAPVLGFSEGEIVLLDGETRRVLGPEDLPKVVNAVEAKAVVREALWTGQELEVGDDPLLMAYLEDTRITTPQKLAERHAQAVWPISPTERAELTRELLNTLQAAQRASKRLYEEVERPLATVLAHMEVVGISLDVDYLQGVAKRLRGRLAELEQSIQTLAGRSFKASSRNQLETLLFDELKLESGRQTALTNKRSTDNETLSALREAHPIIPLILEHREIAKLVGTYLEPLPKWVNPQTGRLHTTFDQTNAATGRLASLDPNLQNIPIRTELGRPIRGAFRAAPGYRLVSADYSQIELRILAHISGDAGLIKAFESGEDIHRITAARVAGVALEAVTREARSQAKTINYGLSYGLSVVGLAERTGMSRGEASRFIRRYFEEYPGIEAYVRETKRFAKEHGYVEDLYGRRRYIPDIAAPGAAIRIRAENAAINMPVQGTCASIIKRAMVEAFAPLRALGAKLLLQVHDELVVEAPEDRVQRVSEVLKKAMCGAAQLKVPLEVEVGHGKTWLEAHEG